MSRSHTQISHNVLWATLTAVLFCSEVQAATSKQPSKTIEDTNPTFEALNDVAFINPKVGWAVGRNSIIIHTEDGGNTWQLQNHSEREDERIFTAVSFADRYHGIVVGTHGQIFRTDDGGKLWVPSAKFHNPQIESTQQEIKFIKQKISDLSEEIIPEDSIDKKTARGGKKTQRDAASKTVTEDFTDQEIDRSRKLVEKRHLTQNLQLLTQRLEQMPEYWRPWNAREQTFNDVAFVDRVNAWIMNGSSLFHSSDQGKTWRRVNMPNDNTDFRAFFFLNNDHGWLVGTDGTIIQTTDGGATFNVQHLDQPWELFDIQFINPTTGFICGQSGLFMRSDDGGKTWRRIETDLREDIFNLTMFSDQKGVATTRGGGAIRTVNGHKWTTFSLYKGDKNHAKETPTPFNFQRLSNRQGVLVGSWGLVATTQNGGDDWSVIRSNRHHENKILEQYKSIRNAKFMIDVFWGYSHPVGSIADRYGPGVNMGIYGLGHVGPLWIGTGLLVYLGGTTEKISPPQAQTIDNPPAEDMKFSGIALEFPLAINWYALELGHWLLGINISAGPRWEGTDLENPWREKVAYSDYNRSRWGIGLSQGLSFTYMFAFLDRAPPGVMISAKRRVSRMGFSLLVGMRESWTWNATDKRADLGHVDKKVFGTELWPFANVSFVIAL